MEEKIKDFEDKYLFSDNNLIITTILNKLDIDNLVITYKELKKV